MMWAAGAYGGLEQSAGLQQSGRVDGHCSRGGWADMGWAAANQGEDCRSPVDCGNSWVVCRSPGVGRNSP